MKRVALIGLFLVLCMVPVAAADEPKDIGAANFDGMEPLNDSTVTNEEVPVDFIRITEGVQQDIDVQVSVDVNEGEFTATVTPNGSVGNATVLVYVPVNKTQYVPDDHQYASEAKSLADLYDIGDVELEIDGQDKDIDLFVAKNQRWTAHTFQNVTSQFDITLELSPRVGPPDDVNFVGGPPDFATPPPNSNDPSNDSKSIGPPDFAGPPVINKTPKTFDAGTEIASEVTPDDVKVGGGYNGSIEVDMKNVSASDIDSDVDGSGLVANVTGNTSGSAVVSFEKSTVEQFVNTSSMVVNLDGEQVTYTVENVNGTEWITVYVDHFSTRKISMINVVSTGGGNEGSSTNGIIDTAVSNLNTIILLASGVLMISGIIYVIYKRRDPDDDSLIYIDD